MKGAQEPTAFGPGAMLRTDDWKLCLYADDLGELYDIANDPYEMSNCFGKPEYAEIQGKMQQRLAKRMLCRGQMPEDLPYQPVR